jgi:lipoprotein NlpI
MNSSKRFFAAAFAFACTLPAAVSAQNESPHFYQQRGVQHFKAGRIRESIADFDRYLEMRPDQEPFHWQRGISYYYAREFAKGVAQFESHKTVNPEDVENAIWHYLCKARLEGSEKARGALLEIRRDRRPWAMKVYAMYQGRATSQEVLRHAQTASRSEQEKQSNLFYSHLYIGLFHESEGRSDEALKHVRIATEQYPSSHYMGHVARVHLLVAGEK